MGFFDSIKKALGGESKGGENIKGPSAALRDAGIDPSGLDFKFGGDGSVTVTGRVADATTRDRITETVGAIPQVSHVDNRVEIGPAPTPAPTPDPEAAPEPPAPAEAASEAPTPPPVADAPESSAAASPDRTVTVESGDSLWKIAEAHYGDGTKYQAIFEANRDILDDPDLIKPGQVLKLPEL